MLETPPHAWGRPGSAWDEAVDDGNTPTCVGKTCTTNANIERQGKHPHMRGEDPERSLNFFLHTWY